MPIDPDDVCLNKAAIIERCLRRILEEYESAPALDNQTRFDALVLNIERACQAAIDLAMHLVAIRRLGMPQTSGDAFSLLESAGLLSDELARSLRAMTGFRNIAIHQYQDLDKEIVRRIATVGWLDLVRFCEALGLRIVAQP